MCKIRSVLKRYWNFFETLFIIIVKILLCNLSKYGETCYTTEDS